MDKSKTIDIKDLGNGEREHFKKLLIELKEGNVSDKSKEKVKKFLQSVDAKTVGVIEKELIKESVSYSEIGINLCDIHFEILKEILVSRKIEVDSPHPVHTLMEEHKIILETLSKLDLLIKRLQNESDFKEMGESLGELKEISHHLIESENHHQREEDVLFPKLEKHNIIEPPKIMKMDHVEFRKRKQELNKLAHNPDDYDFKEFKKKVIELGKYLTGELESHIFKENNLIYQIALQVLNDEEWEEIKKENDKIGYCCFTPEN